MAIRATSRGSQVGCLSSDPFVTPIVPCDGPQLLGFPTFPVLEQPGSNVLTLLMD